MPHPTTTAALTALLSLLSLSTAHAQCDLVWTSANSFPGVSSGTVHTIHSWDPDGAGPLPVRWIFGGDFTYAGTSRTQRLVAHDPATGAWSDFGLPPDGTVRAITTASNGDLVVGGDFTAIGGIAANRIARWNGSQWSAFGAGTDAPAHTLLRLQSGELAVGGAFGTAGGAPAARLARWTNAATWAPGLGGAGVGFNATVRALAQTANGHVYAGGDFTSLSPGGAMSRIARWNGTAWQTLGTLSAGVSGPVHALTLNAAGDLVVGGDFASASGVLLSAGNLVRWNGSSFQAYGNGVGAPFGNTVRAIAQQPNGDLIVGGSFSNAGGGAANLARWVAASNGWSGTGMGAGGDVFALLPLPSGDTLAAGSFGTIGGVAASGLGRRQLGTWSPLAPDRGANDTIFAVAKAENGDLLIGGNATRIDGIPMQGVARRTAGGWQALGAVPTNFSVLAIDTLPNGDVVAVGVQPINTGVCLRWTGSQWLTLGTFDALLTSVVARADGSVIVGGNFLNGNGTAMRWVARWNSGTWQQLAANPPVSPLCMLELANGDLAVGGSGGFAVWNGSTWSTQGATFTGGLVRQILERRNGDLVIAGQFSSINGQPANGAASYHQGQWQPLGLPVGPGIEAIIELPSERLLASMDPGLIPLQLWDGTSWQATNAVPQSTVRGMLYDGNQLLLAGAIHTVNGAVARNLELLGNTCAATAVVSGSGCDGSNGTDTLVARTAPWIGGVFQAEATGLPDFGLRLAVWGFTPTNLPLALVLPLVAPGCALLAYPDILEAYGLAGPTASTQVVLPNDPAVIGVVLHHQYMSIGLDTQLQATEVTATNALVLTVGTL